MENSSKIVVTVGLSALLTLFVSAAPPYPRAPVPSCPRTPVPPHHRPSTLPRNALRTLQLDTLQFHERLAWRANAIGWVLLQPNIGVEWTLGRYNWKRWTAGVYARAWWANSDREAPYIVHDLKEVRGEVRRYTHGSGLKRSWFVGAYGGYADFDLKLSRTGQRGEGFVAGLTAGTIAPLYGYPNGSSLDLELSANAGLLFSRVEQYRLQDGRYVVTSQRSAYCFVWTPLSCLVCNDLLRVTLVYRFGPSVADRYRERVTIDEAYRLQLSEEALRRDSTEQARQREQLRRRDSLERADYERRYEQQRQQLEKRYLRDSLAQIKRERYEK